MRSLLLSGASAACAVRGHSAACPAPAAAAEAAIHAEKLRREMGGTERDWVIFFPVVVGYTG
jgi:hypothetical protein